MVLIDATIGLDNFWQNGVNMNVEGANRISQGDYSMMWDILGLSMR
ncbi:MAG: hypothetical protein IPJ16_02155 [Bacteroidales bacterium]|nr:hypothetical protein [Bacteroidales bacterium]